MALRVSERRQSAAPEPESERPSRISRLSRLSVELRRFKPRRLVPFLGRLVGRLALGCVFVSSSAIALALHLGDPPSRRLAQGIANRVLEPVFEGHLIVGPIDELSLDGAYVRDAVMLDSDGFEVLSASGIRGRIALGSLIGSLIDEGPVKVDLSLARVEEARVLLRPDEDGVPTIATAFIPQDDSPSSPGPSAEVRIERIEIGLADVRAILPGDGGSMAARAGRLSASLRLDQDVFALDIDEAALSAPELVPGGVSGAGSFNLRVPFEEDAGVRMWATFGGLVGTLPVSVRGEVEGDDIRGYVDVPKIDRATLASLVPGFPLEDAASLHLDLEGTAQQLAFDGQLRLEQPGKPALLEFDGQVGLSDTPRIEGRLFLTELSPRSFEPRAPEARFGARGRFRATLDRSPSATLDLSVPPTDLDGQRIPAIDARLVFASETLFLGLAIDEPGAPGRGFVRVDPDRTMHFGLDVRSRALFAVPRLARQLGGSADVSVTGSLDGDDLRASVTVIGNNLTAEGASLRQLRARARLTGPLDQLVIDAEAHAEDIEPGDRIVLESATVRARGPILAPHVNLDVLDDFGGRAAVSAHVSLEQRSARNVQLSLTRKDEVIEGAVEYVAIRPRGVVVRGATLEGAEVGSIQGGLEIDGDEIVGQLRAEAVNLERAATLAGLAVPIAGTASVDIDIERTKSGRRGRFDLEVEDGRAPFLEGLSARLGFSFDDDRIEGSGYVRLIDEAPYAERERAENDGSFLLCDGSIAEVRFTEAEGRLAGPLLDPRTWKGMTGEVLVHAERWNLPCLARRAALLLPLSDVRGELTTRLRVQRADAAHLPTIADLYMRTHRLALAGRRPLLGGEPPWSTDKIDLQLRGRVDGAEENTQLELLAFDGTLLLDASLRSTFDGRKVRAGRFAEALFEAPFALTARVPRRRFSELDTLPEPARGSVPDIAGEFRLETTVRGPLTSPDLSVSLSLFHLGQSADDFAWAPPIDVRVDGTYEASSGRAIVTGYAQLEGQSVASLAAGAEIPFEALRAPKDDEPLPWRGGLTLSLRELPLGSFPPLAERGIGGRVSGFVTARDLNHAPTLEAKLELPMIELGELFFDGVVELRIDPMDTSDAPTFDTGALDAAAIAPLLGTAELDIELYDQEEGSIQVLAHAGVAWQDRLVPVLDPRRAGGFGMSAESFRLGALAPAFGDALSRLDGYLGGSLVLEWGAGGSRRILEGKLAVDDVVVLIPQLGQELREGTARLIATRDGIARLEGVEARGVSGRFTAGATARLDGLKFEGAEAWLEIREGEEIPLTFEGVPLGRARGRVNAAVRTSKDEINLDLSVPTLTLVTSSVTTRNVQPLDEHAEVVVLQPLGPPEPERVDDPTPLRLRAIIEHLRVEAGQLATIEVRTRSDAPVDVLFAKEIVTRGDIEVTRGTFDFLGKEFNVDQGLVRLREEDYENPFVNVTASWEGPDGGTVFIDYVGELLPITGEKVRFRSEPARSERDILATLLFGDSLSTAPGGGAAPSGPARGSDDVAASVGAGVASEGLNQILRNTALRRFSARVGTSDDGALRTGLEYQASDDMRVGLSTERSSAQQVAGTDDALAPVGPTGERNRTEGSFSWRFHRNWSLRASIGFMSDVQTDVQPTTALDVIWQYRY